MASGAREVKASKARHGSGGPTGERWTAPAVAILKDSVSWQNYRIPKLPKPAPRQIEEHQAGSSAVPRRDYDPPGRHSSGVDDMDPLGASDLLGQVLDNMKKAYSMLNCRGSFGFRLQLSPEKISASKLKEVSARPNGKQQTESPGNLPQLCVKCKRKHVSESSAGDTCIRCSLSQVISAEQAAVKGGALMATKRSPPKALETPKHSSRRRTSEDVSAAKLLHKLHSVSSENGHGSMATKGRSPCKTPRKKRKKGPWILSSSESSDEGSPPNMDSLSHRKTKRRIASDQVHTMELKLHRVDCACKQAKETVKRARRSRKTQILDFQTTAFLEHFVEEGVASLDLETRGKITALRMKRLFSDGDSASHSSKQECQKGDKNAIKADREPKIGKKDCGLKVTSNIHKELVLATVPCSKASLLPQGASNCRKGEVDTMEVHRKPNISKKDCASKAASKISKELSLTTVPCSKAFQIPQGASICNKVQRDAMEADRRSKIGKSNDGFDAASIIPKKPVLPTVPCSKTFQMPQGVSSCCKGEADTMEEDHGSKIDEKDDRRKVASKVCKERILAVVPHSKTFPRLQGASNYRKGRRDSMEASCGPKVGKKDNSSKATSGICEKPVLATVSCSKAFQLPQGATNCCKGEGDAIEEDCGSKVGKKVDRPDMASNTCKEHVVVALPLSKVFQLPHKASNYRKGEGFTMEADCRPKISKKNDDPDETSNIRKELVAAVPCSKALHLTQEASINLDGDAMEADCRPKISKKDHSPKVTSNIRKEFIPTAVPCGKAFQLQQGAFNCSKGEENAIEANCGLKIIKKDYDQEDYSKVCKELVLTAVPYNETFQLPQGGFNCHKEEGDVMEADCDPKISEKNDSSKMVANCFKELVEEECKPELGVASILLGDAAATTREGRENLTQVQGLDVPSILMHSCCSLSEADWQSLEGDCIQETIQEMDRVQEAVKSEKDAEVLPTPDVTSSLSDNPGALCIALEGLCKDKGVQIKSETLEPLYLDVNSILDSFDAEEQKTKSDRISQSESNAHHLGDRCLEPSNNDACLLRVQACFAPLPEVGGAHDVRESRGEPLQVCTSILRNSGAVSPPKPRGMSVPFEDGLQIKVVSVDSSCTNKESPREAPEPPGPKCSPPGYPAKQLFGQYLHFLESFFITLDHCTADVRLRLVEALIPRGLVTLKGILEVMRKICRVICCDEIGRVNCMELRVFALLDESVSVSSPAGALEQAMDLTVELCGDDPASGDIGGCCRSPIHPAVPEPVAERRLQESDIPCRKGGVGEESGAPQNLGIFWSSGMAVPRSPLAQSALPGRVEKEGSAHHGGVSAPCVENPALLNPVSGAVCGANMLSMPAPARELVPPDPAGPRPSDVIRPRAVLARSVATSASSVAQAESPASLVVPADQTKSPAFLGPGVAPRLERPSCHRGNTVHRPEGSESVFRSSNLRTYDSLPCRESPTRRAPGPALSHGSAPHWEGRNLLASSGGKAYDSQAQVRPNPAKSGAREAALRGGYSPPRYPLLPQPAGNSSVGQPIGMAAERGTTIRTGPRVSSPKDHQPSGKTGSPRRGGCKDTQVPSLAGQRQTERGVVKMASSEERYTNLPKVRVQPRQQHPARMKPAPPGNPVQEERVAHQASSSAASKPLSPSESIASCPNLSPSCPTGAGLGWQDPRMSLWALHQLFMAHNASQSWTARALGGPPSSAAPPDGGISGVSALPRHDSGGPLETWNSQNLWYHGSLAHHLQMGRATEPVNSDVSQRGQCDVARRRTADHNQSLARQTQQTVTRSSMWNVPSGMREDYGRI